MTTMPMTPAATSSRTTPQPPGKFSSSQPTGGGLTMSKNRNATNPAASGAQCDRSTSAIVTRYPATSSITIFWQSWVPHARSAPSAAMIAIPVIATTTSAYCQRGRGASAIAIGTATAVPHVPGAIGEYPAPPAVARNFQSAFTFRNILGLQFFATCWNTDAAGSPSTDWTTRVNSILALDRFSLLAPALLLLATFLIAFVVYCGLCLRGRAPKVTAVKHNQVFGLFFASFLVWLLGPLERLLLGRVSPNVITAMSLLLCGVTGVAAGLGRLPGAVWLYAFAGILDVLDGRIARLSNRQTPGGALFDSVCDRWGELFVFSGYAWFLHDSPWLLAVMAAIGGSMMVSYTRARAEGLGLELSGGIMQRAERIVLVSGGTLIAAWYGDPVPILGVTLATCGVASIATALHRWLVASRALARRASAPPAALAPAPVRRFRKARPVEQH